MFDVPPVGVLRGFPDWSLDAPLKACDVRKLRLGLRSSIRLFLFVSSFALAVLVKKLYRPWAYQRGIEGLGLADWGPSLFYVFGLEMLIAALICITGRMRHLKYQTMAGVLAGAMAYEISHAFRPDRWFSWSDFIATIVGGLAALLVEVVLTRGGGDPDPMESDSGL